MQPTANWLTRAKWLVMFALVVWGVFFWVIGYAECRADGTNNVVCGISALFTAYIAVLIYGVAGVLWLLNVLLP